MIPLSYNKLTIKQFIEVKAIEENPDKMQVRLQLVSYFTGKNAEEMSLRSHRWKFWKPSLKYYLFRVDVLLASKISDKIKDSVMVKGKRLRGVTDATKLNVNQYTASKELGKNANANFNKIAGLFFYNTDDFVLKDWDKNSELLLSAKVGDIAPTVFFYTKVSERLNQILPSFFLTNQLEIEKELNSLISTTSGMSLERGMVGSM
jgi:hypothetical protein